MILAIILLALTIIGILILEKTYDYDVIGIIMSLIFGLWFIMHIILWATSSYSYNVFLVKRESFVKTLESARKNKSQFELTSLTIEISNWNQQLASNKYDNTLFLLDDYIDDRIDNLKPIE